MQEKLISRLETLRKEFELGQQRLHDLEIQQGNLQQTLLRISGAIQVLEEMLSTDPSQSNGEEQSQQAQVTNCRMGN